MPKTYTTARNAAYAAQNGRCFYCGFPMWRTDRAAFAASHGLTLRQALRFQCTGEHLVAQRDRGSHGRGNIVAACRHCNLTRHRLLPPPEPTTYRNWVQTRTARGRWHPAWPITASRRGPQ